MGQGKRRCKRGLLLPAPPCPLMSRLPVIFGWFSWLGVVAEGQSRFSVLSVPSCCTRQGLAELLGGIGSTELGRGQGPHWQHLLLYTTQRCKAALKSYFLDNIVCFRPVSLARKKIFLLKKKKENTRKKLLFFKTLLLIYWHFRERWYVMCLTSRYWAEGGSSQVFNFGSEECISYPFRAPNPYL